MWNATFESKVEPKSNLRLFQSQIGQTSHLIETVEFNWFKRRTSRAFNSLVKFGTCEIRRLNRASVIISIFSLSQIYFVSQNRISRALLTGTIWKKLNTHQSQSEPRKWKRLLLSSRIHAYLIAIMLKFSSTIIISNPNLQRRNYSMPEKPQPLICEAILVFLISW